MCLPLKEYHSLAEICRLWQVTYEDLLYYGENGLLNICVRFTAIKVALGESLKQLGVDREKVFEREDLICEPQALRVTDIYRIIKANGEPVIVNSFKNNNRFSFTEIVEKNGIQISLDDLVITRSDKIRFELDNDIQTKNDHEAPVFKYSNSFQEVIHFGKRHHFGPLQAKIVEQLFLANEKHEPWVHGKILLSKAGSESLRFTSVFKGHRTWREIIFSDHKGYYRLNLPSWAQLQLPLNKIL